jgi:hypothetical protein
LNGSSLDKISSVTFFFLASGYMILMPILNSGSCQKKKKINHLVNRSAPASHKIARVSTYKEKDEIVVATLGFNI